MSPGGAAASRGPVAALLEAIPDPALLISTGRRVLEANTRFRQTFAGDLEPRGRPCFAVCHGRSSACLENGESCPLESSLEARREVRAVHVHRSAEGDLHCELIVRPVVDASGEPVAMLEVQRPLRIASARPSPFRLVGRSRGFNEALLEIARLGPTDKPIVVAGEPGTGKELFARAIHEISPRRAGPFVPVDAAALEDWRFERELFGQERSGGNSPGEGSEGLVGVARGGSLFLRRIEDLPEMAQLGLLRLLETGRWRPAGAACERRSDFRLICSTSVDLEELSHRGRFRTELLQRIGTFAVGIPPLRDRPDDLPLLVESFLAQYGHPVSGRRISAPALEVLRAHPFPGNLRELASVIEHAALQAEGDELRLEHLPEALRDPSRAVASALRFAGAVVPLREAMQRYVDWVRERTGATGSELARWLGADPEALDSDGSPRRDPGRLGDG